MADRVVLEAKTRTLLGKKVKNIRRQGRIPATVYGHDVEAVSIEVDARQFRTAHHSAGDNQLIDLVLDGKRARPVLIHSTQVDPRRNTAMHIEFYQANLKEKLIAHIPIHLTGEAPAAKHGLFVLTNLDTLELECLPTDLPANIEVDISGLEEVGASIHVRDLTLDRTTCEVKTPEDEVVVHVTAPQVVREEEVEGEATVAGEVGSSEAPAATGGSPSENQG